MSITPADEISIARLLRADAAAVRAFAGSLPENRRAHLALFCHARSHYRELWLLIAKECSPYALKAVGGHAGDFLAGQVQQAEGVTPLPRQAISLAKAAEAIVFS